MFPISIPDFYDIKKPIISQSLFQEYLLCDYRFLYNINLYTFTPNDMVTIGIFGHYLLEHIYGDPTFNLDSLVNNYKFPTNSFNIEKQEYVKNVMWILITHYLKRYPAFIDWDVKTESEFKVDTDYVTLVGKMDGVVHRDDGIWLLENKFKSQIVEEKLDKKLKMDWQSLFYLLAYFLKNNVMPKGVLYNVIRFPQKGYKKKGLESVLNDLSIEIENNPEYYFYRWEVEFSKEDIESFSEDLFGKIRELSTKTKWYRNRCACDLPFLCPYIDACTDNDFSQLKRKNKLFEELEHECTGKKYINIGKGVAHKTTPIISRKPKLILTRNAVRGKSL